jgi:hypothetical protein
MMLNYYGHDFTPDTLNAVYKEKGVFDQGNLINFWAAANVFGDITADEYYNCLDVPCDMSKVNDYLDGKKPVIAFVDNVYDDKKPDHFVLIIGKDEHGAYFINDPWMGETYYFHSKYGAPAQGIYGLRLYTGTPKDGISPEDKINDLTSKLKSCNETVADKSLETNELRDALQAQEKDNADLSQQLLKTRGERDTKAWEVERLEVKITTLDETIEKKDQTILVQNEKVAQLREDLAECKKKSVEGLTTWDLIKLIFTRR